MFKVTETTNLKSWYCEMYPDDELRNDFDNNATFKTLFHFLDSYKDVYEIIPSDSLVRERCFLKLSQVMGVDYDYIYRQWLKSY